MRADEATPSVEAFAAELARSELAAQHELLKELRGGAGLLLAAASLIASFLGSEALDRSGLTLVAWLAIASFVVALVSTLVVLTPRVEVETADAVVFEAALWILQLAGTM